jgi:hypothetical protein
MEAHELIDLTVLAFFDLSYFLSNAVIDLILKGKLESHSIKTTPMSQ